MANTDDLICVLVFYHPASEASEPSGGQSESLVSVLRTPYMQTPLAPLG